MTVEVSVSLEVRQDGKLLRSRSVHISHPRARTMLSEAVHAVMDLAAAAGQAEGVALPPIGELSGHPTGNGV